MEKFRDSVIYDAELTEDDLEEIKKFSSENKEGVAVYLKQIRQELRAG